MNFLLNCVTATDSFNFNRACSDTLDPRVFHLSRLCFPEDVIVSLPFQVRPGGVAFWFSCEYLVALCPLTIYRCVVSFTPRAGPSTSCACLNPIGPLFVPRGYSCVSRLSLAFALSFRLSYSHATCLLRVSASSAHPPSRSPRSLAPLDHNLKDGQYKSDCSLSLIDHCHHGFCQVRLIVHPSAVMIPK